MSDKLNNLEFEVEDLVTGLSIFASSSKKQPYQKPLVIEIDLSGNSRGIFTLAQAKFSCS